MKKILLLFFAALLVLSCSSANKYGFSQKLYDKGDMAYIVLGAGNNASHNDIHVDSYFVFVNEQGKKIQIVLKDEETRSFLIKPGNYYISKYYLYGESSGALKFWTGVKNSISIDFTKYVQGSFTVNAGDTVYLGFVSTVLSDMGKTTWKRFVNFGIDPKEIKYETTVQDRLTDVTREPFNKEANKNIETRLLNWSKK